MDIKIGDRVRVFSDLGNRDYSQEGIAARNSVREYVNGSIGVVDYISNSHGECYKVVFDKGKFAFFDPDEVERV